MSDKRRARRLRAQMSASSRLLNRTELPVGEAEPVPAYVPEQIPDDLPTITAPSYSSRLFNVMRAEHPEGDPAAWQWVVIYQSRDKVAAMRVCSAQKYRCMMKAHGDKTPFTNYGKPMKAIPRGPAPQ